MQGSGCLGAHVLPRGYWESKAGPVLSRNHFLRAEHVSGLSPYSLWPPRWMACPLLLTIMLTLLFPLNLADLPQSGFLSGPVRRQPLWPLFWKCHSDPSCLRQHRARSGRLGSTVSLGPGVRFIKTFHYEIFWIYIESSTMYPPPSFNCCQLMANLVFFPVTSISAICRSKS